MSIIRHKARPHDVKYLLLIDVNHTGVRPAYPIGAKRKGQLQRVVSAGPGRRASQTAVDALFCERWEGTQSQRASSVLLALTSYPSPERLATLATIFPTRSLVALLLFVLLLRSPRVGLPGRTVTTSDASVFTRHAITGQIRSYVIESWRSVEGKAMKSSHARRAA
jgi:hypothetical protein